MNIIYIYIYIRMYMYVHVLYIYMDVRMLDCWTYMVSLVSVHLVPLFRPFQARLEVIKLGSQLLQPLPLAAFQGVC